MTRIAVTGATGNLGRLTIAELRAKGIGAADITAIVRNVEKAKDLSAAGIDVRTADYTNPDALVEALQGVDRLLLISSSEVGQRAAHHGNIISAAKQAGVNFIAYTSLLHGTDSKLKLADEHAQTEQLLAEAGIPFALLRNGWYIENYESAIETALQLGKIFGAAGDGVFAPAARRDFAKAAAEVISGMGHEGKIYELGGDERVTMSQLAAIVADVSGDEVEYVNLSENDYQAMLEEAGIPTPFAQILADSDAQIANGQLDTTSGDLAKLIGTPTATIRSTITPQIAQFAVSNS